MENIVDKIGFLPRGEMIEFVGGILQPVDNFADLAKEIDAITNKDGFVYPPQVKNYTAFPIKGGRLLRDNELEWEEVPRTERPALLHLLPASHQMIIENFPDGRNFRESDGAFLMHLVAYLFGIRLQFHDWWFDGRVPIKSTNNIFVTPKGTSKFISHSYFTWKKWKDSYRYLFTNILYMNSRSTSYEWDWEQFIIDYMVLDACYYLSQKLYGVKGNNDIKKITNMCNYFGLKTDEDFVRLIVRLRHDLLHRTLWDGSQPCTAIRTEVWQQVHVLRNVNQRLIPAILGFDTDFIKIPWNERGTCFFA